MRRCVQTVCSSSAAAGGTAAQRAAGGSRRRQEEIVSDGRAFGCAQMKRRSADVLFLLLLKSVC